MKRDRFVEFILSELESDGAYFQEVGGRDGFVNGISWSLSRIEDLYKKWQEEKVE